MLDAFVQWYVENLFGVVDKEKLTDREKFAAGIAKEYGIPISVVDKVKRRFDYFDLDGSNAIDYDEFAEMIAKLMRAKDRTDIAEARIKRWFKEADPDGSGEVSFEEFVVWYLKYFNPDNEAENGLDQGPVGHFYSSYNPQVQRRNNRRSGVSHDMEVDPNEPAAEPA